MSGAIATWHPRYRPLLAAEGLIEAHPRAVSLVVPGCPAPPEPPQWVRVVPGRSFARFAIDAAGWVYYRYDHPHGWTVAGHVADYIAQAFADLARCSA